MDALEDSIAVDLNKLAHNWHCSAAQVTGWDEKETLFNDHSRKVKQAYNLIGKSLLPWYKQWAAEEKSLADLWRQFKEEEKDPEYAKVLKAEREKLYSKVKDAETSTQRQNESMRKIEEDKIKREKEHRKRQERFSRARLRSK